jgi:hypothetical protein
VGWFGLAGNSRNAVHRGLDQGTQRGAQLWKRPTDDGSWQGRLAVERFFSEFSPLLTQIDHLSAVLNGVFPQIDLQLIDLVERDRTREEGKLVSVTLSSLRDGSRQIH